MTISRHFGAGASVRRSPARPPAGRPGLGPRAWLSSLCLCLCLAGYLGQPGQAAAAPAGAVPALALQVRVGDQPLRLNQTGQLADHTGRPMAVSRLDLLLSSFSLQRADGRWTPATGWHAFFRADQPARRQALPAVAPGRYVAARFTVGVDPRANHADPNRLRPDDPLHPVVNGLHWGWMGGYVFVALEGHWQPTHAPAGSVGGFSYHLGGDANRVEVTLPVRLEVRRGDLLRLSLDVGRLLPRLDVSRDGDSTHSRQQDAVVRALKAALPGAFALAVDTGLAPTDAARPADRQVPAGARAYPLATDARLPTATLPDDNPLTVAGVALGRRLFDDRRLSRDRTLACASCHQAGRAFSDGDRAVSIGVDGRRGQRNAMPLFNLAWVDAFFWDGRVDRLRRQALEPIQHPDEMGASLPQVVARLAADPRMVADFRRVFGGPVTAERIGLALEQYLLSIVSQDSKFDRVAKGADRFTPAEQRGYELFLTEHDPPRGLYGADCFHCHGGALFTNHRFANNGLPATQGDTGRERVTADPADRGKFRVPSLRNVALTGPYMHDGRFRTLEEVVEHYDHGAERSPTLDPNIAKHPAAGLKLSRDDQAALVAFLKTLTDPAFSRLSRVPATAR